MEPAGHDSPQPSAGLPLPGVPPRLLSILAEAAGRDRLALVGGAVRDLLLHRVHSDPWRGLPDLDLVIEGRGGQDAARALAERLAGSGRLPLCSWKEHGAYGTVAITLQLADGDATAEPSPEPSPAPSAGATLPASAAPIAAASPDPSPAPAAEASSASASHAAHAAHAAAAADAASAPAHAGNPPAQAAVSAPAHADNAPAHAAQAAAAVAGAKAHAGLAPAHAAAGSSPAEAATRDAPGGMAAAGDGAAPFTAVLDVATARLERYPVAAANPVVRFGSLEDDLARRDFTINAMALLLGEGLQLLDPHGGQRDLQERQLRFLHPASLRDDPTRLLRAARYQARLGFRLAPESRDLARRTLLQWPWPWRPGDPAERAPAALGTRLRMELQLLLEREPWPAALAALQELGGLALLDPALQADRHWRRRLLWAERLGLPRIVALLAAAEDPPAVARRLQLPLRQQRWLEGLQDLRRRLAEAAPDDQRSPAAWTALLEAPGLPPQAVGLALAAGIGARRPLLRWWLRWRHIRPAVAASDLIAAGERPGPALGERLRRLRAEQLDAERL